MKKIIIRPIILHFFGHKLVNNNFSYISLFSCYTKPWRQIDNKLDFLRECFLGWGILWYLVYIRKGILLKKKIVTTKNYKKSKTIVMCAGNLLPALIVK